MARFPRRAVFFFVALAGVATGCASSGAPAPAVNLQGFPPAYREGYAAGCAVARGGAPSPAAGRRVREDAVFRLGHDDGKNACASARGV